MTIKYLISVIIPCYNHAHFLHNALISVLNQTYTNWEAIIIDDGSTDDTSIVASQFTDPRIRYCYQTNSGLAAARNKGIAQGQGDFLAFLDADDEWHPSFLDSCIKVLDLDTRCSMVYTHNLHIDQAGNVLPQVNLSVVKPDQIYNHLIEGGFFPPCAVLARAKVIRECGGFDEGLEGQGTEDWDLWLSVAKKHSICCNPEPLARYRVYSGSMSSNIRTMHINRMSVLNKHFGKDEGTPNDWKTEKRIAYAFAYRSYAFSLNDAENEEMIWELIAKAAYFWPPILNRLDTYYELALGNQPKGYRDTFPITDLKAKEKLFLHHLDLISTQMMLSDSFRRQVKSKLYLALAMLSDRAGKWDLSRLYFVKSFTLNPVHIYNLDLVKRLMRVSFGKYSPLLAHNTNKNENSCPD